MGRTDSWGDEPLKRAKHLIKFLVRYNNTNRDHLSAEWRNENSTRPELEVRTTLVDLAWLLDPERVKSNRSSEAKKEKPEIQSTIDRLKKLRVVKEDDNYPGEKSKGIRRFTFILWHTSSPENNCTQLELAWGNRLKSEKFKGEQTLSVSDSPKSDVAKKELDPQLERTITAYLSKSFSNNQYAELDQAGEPETGGERTKLKQVFIDLKVKPCERISPPDWTQKELTQFDDDFCMEGSNNHSAMKCLLGEKWLKFVIIGGPGQGKSTLGQQIAQVYRAKYLPKPYDFTDRIHKKRIPFRVVLKYFAQWLANKPDYDSLEAYLAQDIGSVTERFKDIDSAKLQDIFLSQECLLILDGLDEVVDPNLQERMLKSIYRFLDWAEDLNVNLKVVATSRPNIYEDQFDPKSFLHLELLPLSSEQVEEYAGKWVHRRDLPKEEQDRIIRTLNECQQDQRISTLLKTPLQVTIILLIIKNGGRPPGEREALFDEYWNTILKREKSKDKDIIKVDDTTLLDLNAYIGYLLHRRASNENVQSLLPEEEFKSSLIKFLRENDNQSSDNDINLRVEQFVSDAKDRLVLIVSPITGFFGFELRSFQEFFAAAYLFKNLDTQKCFEYLKLMVGSEHWHFVALFLAGRIVRISGKKPAHGIVREVCRPVDQPINEEEVANHYLRPGAWFALEVAADGSLSKLYRDLQREAIDYGLEVLETGLTQGQQDKLSSLIEQLSEKDKSDLLRPALEVKLNSKDLPETCWEIALHLYGKHFGSTQFFQHKIDNLLETQEKNFVVPALNQALRYESEPLWMVERLENYWSYWKEDVQKIFLRSNQYTEKVLNSWSLSQDQVTELAEAIFDHFWIYKSIHSIEEVIWELPEPKTFSEQLVLLLRCLRLIAYFRMEFPNHHSRIRTYKDTPFFIRANMNPQLSVLDDAENLRVSVEYLLQDSDLMPELQVSLWMIFWLINQPNQTNVSRFFDRMRSIEISLVVSTKLWFYSSLREIWPILALVIEQQKIRSEDVVNRFLPFLDANIQISIHSQLVKIVEDYLKESDNNQKQQLFIALETQIGLDEILPELKELSKSMGVTVDDLVGAYITVYPRYGYSSSLGYQYTVEQLQKLLTTAKDTIQQANKPITSLWTIFKFSWPSDPEVIEQARQLLELILNNYSEDSESPIVELSAILFLKLLVYDTHIQEILPRLFTILPLTGLLKIRKYWLRHAIIDEVTTEYLSLLISLMEHEQEPVRVGITLILKAIIETMDSYKSFRNTEFKNFRNMKINSSLGMSFINDKDSKRRLIGITLVTLSSDYPVEEVKYRNLILDNLKQPKTDEEEPAWHELLQEIYMPEEKQIMWCKLLEEILKKPVFYSSSVLSIAMERYQELAKIDEVIIPEID